MGVLRACMCELLFIQFAVIFYYLLPVCNINHIKWGYHIANKIIKLSDLPLRNGFVVNDAATATATAVAVTVVAHFITILFTLVDFSTSLLFKWMIQKNSEVLILLNEESLGLWEMQWDKMKWKWTEKRRQWKQWCSCYRSWVFNDVFKVAVANQKEMRMLNYGGNNI